VADMWTIYESPFGRLTIVGSSSGLTELHFPGRGGPFEEADRDDLVLSDAVDQLTEYFAGTRTAFDLRLDVVGTPFQRTVWEQLNEIPYGTTINYSELAQAIGRPDRLRAAAGTVGRTPIPIIIPCHRVIGANGDLTGYLGGLQRKQTLLDLEAKARRREPLATGWQAQQLPLI
jgi:methylated-DNA-[protein]-cysteine S-methyltransferase